MASHTGPVAAIASLQHWAVAVSCLLPLTPGTYALVSVPQSAQLAKADAGGNSFGQSCSGSSRLAEEDAGLCCCRASGILAYGARGAGSVLCKDDNACTGSDSGFCARRPQDGAPRYFQQATRSFCQFSCPCCEGVSALQVKNGSTSGSPLLEKWRAEPVALFDVVNGSFHRELLKSLRVRHTLREFHEARLEYPIWQELAAIREERNWTEQELAIYMYTTEVPMVYGPMNRMMREARRLEDIDEYWQSYMAMLQQGLVGHAPFVVAESYRGVDCDAKEALFVGEQGVLPSFTSTSTELSVAEGFGCSVLHFKGGGYDLRRYSAFPFEAELLLEQGRVYNVTRSVAEEEGGQAHIYLETDASASARAAVSVSEKAPKYSCQGFDTSLCQVCRCCNRPPVAQLAEKACAGRALPALLGLAALFLQA